MLDSDKQYIRESMSCSLQAFLQCTAARGLGAPAGLQVTGCCTSILQGNNSLPQGLKASMLGALRTEAPRKVAVAYDTLEAGRQMLAWAARFCLQRNDELYLVQYSKVGQC